MTRIAEQLKQEQWGYCYKQAWNCDACPCKLYRPNGYDKVCAFDIILDHVLRDATHSVKGSKTGITDSHDNE